MLAVCTESGSLHISEYTLQEHKIHHLNKVHKKMIRSVKFTGDGNRAVTGSDDCEIKIIDLQKMTVNLVFLITK